MRCAVAAAGVVRKVHFADLTEQGRLIGEVMLADPKGNIANTPMTWGVVVNKKDGLAYVNDFNSGLWTVRIEPKRGAVP